MEDFIVGRYEAGIPETADFYPDAENEFEYKPQYVKNVVISDVDKDIRNKGDIAPISKKNTPSWSCISQENAVEAAKLMVPDKSYLIDGTAWDTIVEWIGEKDKTVTDSKTVGNYYSSEGTIPAGTMYIKHTYDGVRTSGDKYQKADSDINQPKGSGNDRYEVYTGSLENTKLKNIYDMAGNMWEWTTETSKYNSGSSSTVIRGGSFENHGSDTAICRRNGDFNTTSSCLSIGFRVVLYL